MESAWFNQAINHPAESTEEANILFIFFYLLQRHSIHHQYFSVLQWIKFGVGLSPEGRTIRLCYLTHCMSFVSHDREEGKATFRDLFKNTGGQKYH